MAFGDLYRMAFEYSISAQVNVNVMYFKDASVGSIRSAQTAAEDMALLMRSAYGNILSTSSRAPVLKVSCTKVARLFSDAGERAENLVGSPGVVLTLPPTNAVVMRIKTGLADRTRRGRIFLGGIPSDRVQDGVLNASGATLYGTFLTLMNSNFIGNSPASGFQLGVFSRTRYAIVSNPFDEYFVKATQLQIANAVASMRSRKVGVGA